MWWLAAACGGSGGGAARGNDAAREEEQRGGMTARAGCSDKDGKMMLVERTNASYARLYIVIT